MHLCDYTSITVHSFYGSGPRIKLAMGLVSGSPPPDFFVVAVVSLL